MCPERGQNGNEENNREGTPHTDSSVDDGSRYSHPDTSDRRGTETLPCESCGTELTAHHVFCPECGTRAPDDSGATGGHTDDETGDNQTSRSDNPNSLDPPTINESPKQESGNRTLDPPDPSSPKQESRTQPSDPSEPDSSSQTRESIYDNSTSSDTDSSSNALEEIFGTSGQTDSDSSSHPRDAIFENTDTRNTNKSDSHSSMSNSQGADSSDDQPAENAAVVCVSCGTSVTDEYIYCPECGTNVRNQSGSRNPEHGERHGHERSRSNTTSQHSVDEPAPVLEQETRVLQSLIEQDRQDGLARYRGTHTRTNTTVTVYTIADQTCDEDGRTAFTRAVNGWYNGHTHPNILTIHDRGTEPKPWIAVEHISDSPTLADCERVSPEEIVPIVTDTAEAIRNVALYNARHGNLSPARIWVLQDRTAGVQAKIDGWGIRRAVSDAHGEPKLTPYTAPEQLSDKYSQSNGSVDIYRLGAVAYYGLTGEPPAVAEREAILDDDTIPPSEVAGIDTRFDQPVMRALATDPQHRFNSVYDFGQALSRGR
jgi:predicted RNA-binding Zn-ribbon protein involved in translation (DUF1610 family)